MDQVWAREAELAKELALLATTDKAGLHELLEKAGQQFHPQHHLLLK